MLLTMTRPDSPQTNTEALFLFAACAFAYLTAFMETLTISHFPYCAQL